MSESFQSLSKTPPSYHEKSRAKPKITPNPPPHLPVTLLLIPLDVLSRQQLRKRLRMVWTSTRLKLQETLRCTTVPTSVGCKVQSFSWVLAPKSTQATTPAIHPGTGRKTWDRKRWWHSLKRYFLLLNFSPDPSTSLFFLTLSHPFFVFIFLALVIKNNYQQSGASKEKGHVLVPDHVPKVKDFFEKECWSHHPKPHQSYVEYKKKQDDAFEKEANKLIPGM